MLTPNGPAIFFSLSVYARFPLLLGEAGRLDSGAILLIGLYLGGHLGCDKVYN